jgi:hypothetical protein
MGETLEGEALSRDRPLGKGIARAGITRHDDDDEARGGEGLLMLTFIGHFISKFPHHIISYQIMNR